MKCRILAVAFASLIVTAACNNPAGSQPAHAESQTTTQFPRLTGRIVDEANLLRPEQKIALARKSETLEAQTGRQFVVVTANSLLGQDVAIYTRDLGRHWGIGRKDYNDGVILLVAPNERKVRIAVGYGSAGILTDARADQVIREQVLPRFRQGDIAGGIAAGADTLIELLGKSPQLSISSTG